MIPAMSALVELSHNALTNMVLFILKFLDDTTPVALDCCTGTPSHAAGCCSQSITLLTQMNRNSQHFSHGIRTMRQRSRCTLKRERVAGQMRRVFFTVTPRSEKTQQMYSRYLPTVLFVEILFGVRTITFRSISSCKMQNGHPLTHILEHRQLW